jgi:glutaredoxin-related protein
VLKKESTLYKEKDGRIVYYIFYEDPPKGIKPFWFTRIFCIVPAYFERALYFARLYFSAEKYVDQYTAKFQSGDRKTLIKNFKFLIGIIILNIFKNRTSKCVLCQFSKREMYGKLEEMMKIAIKDRSDVLPEEMLDILVEKYSEIPVFNGIFIKGEKDEDTIIESILKFSDDYKKDLDFQIMVSSRRKTLRLKQQEALENQDIEV